MHPKKQDKKPTIKILILAVVCIALMVSFTACTDETAPVPVPVQNPKKKAAAKTVDKADSEEKSANEALKKEYFYNPNGKVDPFVPLITGSPSSEPVATETTKKRDVPLTPLQKLDIDDFTLVAIISSADKLTALIQDPAVNGFIVTEGMLIGRNGGVIKKILPTSIIIEEQSPELSGQNEMKIKTITLKKK